MQGCCYQNLVKEGDPDSNSEYDCPICGCTARLIGDWWETYRKKGSKINLQIAGKNGGNPVLDKKIQ